MGRNFEMINAMEDLNIKNLPTTVRETQWIPTYMLSSYKLRKLRKSFRNLRITVICCFMTILVLRGTIGAGNFGTPGQDMSQIRQHIALHRKESGRALGRVKEITNSRDVETKHVQEAKDEGISPVEKSYSLGAKISDWDIQRQEWLNKHPQTDDKPRILLVTGSQPNACDNPVGDHYLLKSLKNKIDYCRLHSIDIFYNMAHLDSEMAGYWAKLPLIRKLMISHPEVEWIWWMDSDALFTDMEFELPMVKYKDYNLVLHGWDEQVYEKKSWVGLNTGSFLLRNCQWSLDLLDAWAPMGPKGSIRTEAGKLLSSSLAGRPDFEADDQSALIYLLGTHKSRWGGKIHLENSYYLHGYWAVIVDKYEEMMDKYHPGLGDERWPFVTHFVGCKPCGKYGDYPVERCLHHMERAFNFADNQVLQIYGLTHTSLSSPDLQRIPHGHE